MKKCNKIIKKTLIKNHKLSRRRRSHPPKTKTKYTTHIRIIESNKLRRGRVKEEEGNGKERAPTDQKHHLVM